MLHFWIPKKWTIRDWIIGKHHIHCHHCRDQVGLLLLPCTDDNSENPVCTCKVYLEMHLQGLSWDAIVRSLLRCTCKVFLCAKTGVLWRLQCKILHWDNKNFTSCVSEDKKHLISILFHQDDSNLNEVFSSVIIAVAIVYRWASLSLSS